MASEDRKPDPPQFDADYNPKNPINRKAAEARGLRFDEGKKAYVDSGGALVRDRFGQPY